MTEGLQIRIEGEIPPGAESSPVRARFTREAAEDAQGQGYKYGDFAPVGEDDTEGQGGRWTFLPAERDDTEGQGKVERSRPGRGRRGPGCQVQRSCP